MRVACVCENPACSVVFFIEPSRLVNGKRPYCSRRCWNIRPKPIGRRFWAKVQRCTHEEWCIYCCWPWLGSKNEFGYGKFSIKKDGKPYPERAHRIAWELFQQKQVPDGLWILHYCDYKPCCNPAHLYPGTREQNTQDAIDRGRLIGRYHGKPASGEQLPQAKLTNDLVYMIRQRHAAGEMQSAIAKELGMSKATICMVVNRRTWTHIP